MSAALAQYLDAVERGDAEGAIAVAVAEVDRGAPPEAVMCDLVGTAQAEVGRRWEAGEWSVAAEHLATAISEEVVGVLGRLATDPPTKGKVVVACVEGEWHSLPARIASAVLRRSGWEVSFVGASVPADQLAGILHDLGPHAVAVSCVVPANLPGARRVVETARAGGTPVVAGGAGFGADGRWARVIGANQWAPFAMEASGVLESLPSVTGPAPPLDHPRMVEHHIVEHRRRGMLAEIGRRWEGFEVSRTSDFASWAIRSLSAALLVGDREVFDGYVRWLVHAYRPRGISEPEVTWLLEQMAAGLGDEAPTAAAWLAAAARLAAAPGPDASSGG